MTSSHEPCSDIVKVSIFEAFFSGRLSLGWFSSPLFCVQVSRPPFLPSGSVLLLLRLLPCLRSWVAFFTLIWFTKYFGFWRGLSLSLELHSVGYASTCVICGGSISSVAGGDSSVSGNMASRLLLIGGGAGSG
jgi:hypothetical protein